MGKKLCRTAQRTLCAALLCLAGALPPLRAETGNPAGHADTPATAAGHTDYTPLDMSYENHSLIIKYHNEYNSAYNRIKLKEIMLRAAPYRPYIRRKLKERNLPLCLEFLPVIESNYNPRAVSKSGATGLWQFMENSISGILTKDSWVDERRDPWRSTDAALQKLEDNYNYFKDWPLALAAYNMGLGGLARTMKSSGCETLWELVDGGYLRTETQNYVPKFLAVAELLTNAEYYGLDIPEYNETAGVDFSVIPLQGQVDLEEFSAKADISLSELRELNAALLHTVTPATRPYDLRVPKTAEQAAKNALSQMDIFLMDVYTVKKGDTLWGISRSYGTSVKELCKANGLDENGILRIGTTLLVPIHK